MGASVLIFIALPWLDHSPAKSMRYRPGWHFWLLIVWVVAFIVLGYFGTQPPSAAGPVHLDGRHGHLLRLLRADAVVESDGRRSSRCPTASPSIRTERAWDKNEELFTGWRAACRPARRHRYCAGRGRRDSDSSSGPRERAREFSSLQNGARLFVNYCMGCHSASLVRWNRLEQIGLDDKQIKEFLIFGNQKVGDTMRIAMTPAEAKVWFGKAPPDLSVIARARTSFEYKGTDYIYTLLRGYYRDNSTATGWNNIAYPNIGMPHILWDRQGPREATPRVHTHRHVDPKTRQKATCRRRPSTPPTARSPRPTRNCRGRRARASATPSSRSIRSRRATYDADVADLVGFLAFITDPSRYDRVQIGVWVLVFLGAVHAVRLAPQFGLLEGHQISSACRVRDPAGRTCTPCGLERTCGLGAARHPQVGRRFAPH